MNEYDLKEAIIELIELDDEIAYRLFTEIKSYDDSISLDEMYPFDEEFFMTFFSEKDPMEICRATYFGDIQSWNDEWIGFNTYGNLISMSDYDYRRAIQDHAEEIAERTIELCDHIDLPSEIQDLVDECLYDDDDDEESLNTKPIIRKPSKPKTAAKKSPSKKPAKKVVSKPKAKKPTPKKAVPRRK